ncbi:MAG: hypothetical protein HKO64_11710, partial [Xanthomonadales bacterium]|nr:hypothetical protein [Xanthomonadales bacterium]
MNTAVLQLNDQSLLMLGQDAVLHEQPGFARVDGEGIITGEAARATAWLQPQHSYNQFWVHLNQAPLASGEKWARHHADIAFAQLKALWQTAGEPQQLVLLVPASFDDSQLSLLLGLANALPAEVTAMLDSALAAAGGQEGDFLHLDMQLHQTVGTWCRGRSGIVRIKEQEVFPNLGLLQLYNTVARYISNLLIDSARFDPLHSSDTEQFIFDQMPDWLTRLRWDGEFSASLDTAKGQLPFILRNDRIRELLGERLTSVSAFVDRHKGMPLVLSHETSVLAPYADIFSQARIAARTEALNFVLSNLQGISEQVDELYRVRSLVLDQVTALQPVVNGRQATHLLHGDRAIPLHRPVSIRLTETGLVVSTAIERDASLTVVARDGTLEEVARDSAVDSELPPHCAPGASIRVGGHA